MPLISPPMMDEIERRKENIRRVWDYKRVDHIPIMLQVLSNPWGYTVQEHFLDGDKQFQIELEQVKLSLELVPDDYIPAMRPDVGCVVIESALGAEVVFADDPNQTCTIKEPILERADDIYKLKTPNPNTDGLVPEGLKRIKSFVERTDGQVYVSCLDMGGSMNVAFTLLGSIEFYMLSYDNPEALEYLANFIADVFIHFAEVSIE
ncbi:MAG: uroporphyrinogen decarboxylase family protein, partial [Armatimonadota bacterium]|nr:uroporphyrinogen decarboxylase family protein [Armatimonadota bacterium]